LSCWPSGLKIDLLLLLLSLNGCVGFRLLGSSEFFFVFALFVFVFALFVFVFALEPASPCRGNDTSVDQCVLALDYAFGATWGRIARRPPGPPRAFA
jgi:hypothetical protein